MVYVIVGNIVHVVNVSVQSWAPSINIQLGDRVEEEDSIESNSSHLFNVVSLVREVLGFIWDVVVDGLVLVTQKGVELRLSVSLRVFKAILWVPVEQHFVINFLFFSSVLIGVVAVLRQSV